MTKATAPDKLENTARSLARRYILALSLIALLTLTGQALIQWSLGRVLSDSRLIELAGRQRMLGRLIARQSTLIGELRESDRLAADAARVRGFVAEWEQVHQGLLNGDPGLGLAHKNSPAVHRLFEELESPRLRILEMSRRLLSAQAGAAPPGGGESDALMQAVDDYKAVMDKIVFQYDAEASSRLLTIRRIEIGLMTATLLTLLLEAAFIFRPAVRRIGEDFKRLVEARDRLEQLSRQDSLTLLANRRHLEEYLTREWYRSRRRRECLAMIMADIDHFKSYNDGFGHPAGDEVLRRVADAALGSIRRRTDLAARYGGEEVLLILPDTDESGALEVAERFRLKVRELGIQGPGDSPGPVTISLGVAAVVPKAAMKPFDLVQQADQALYKAKVDGRDRTATHSTLEGETPPPAEDHPGADH